MNTPKDHTTTLLSNDRLITKSKKKIYYALSILGIILVALFGFYFFFISSGYKYSIAQSSLLVAEVKKIPFIETIPFRGEIKPIESVRLDVVTSGRVEEIYQKAGAQIAKGTPLFRISNEELELSISSREISAIDQLNNQQTIQLNIAQMISSEKIEYENAKYMYERALREKNNLEILAKTGAAKQNDLVRKDEDWKFWQQALKVRETSLTALQKLADTIDTSTTATMAQLNDIIDSTKRQKESLTVRAPISGLLTSLNLNIGQQVTTGLTIGQIEKTIGYKVEASLDEYYLSSVAINQKVSVTIGKDKYILKISNISPQIVNKQFKIECSFDGPQPEQLKSGQTILGKLELSDRPDNVLAIPLGAFLENTGGMWIYKIAHDGTAKRTNITLGRRNNDYIEVTSGLVAGDQIILSSYDNFKNYEQLDLKGN